MRSLRSKLNNIAAYRFPGLSQRCFDLEGLGVFPPERHGHINGSNGTLRPLEWRDDHRRDLCTPFGPVMRTLREIKQDTADRNRLGFMNQHHAFPNRSFQALTLPL